MILSQELLDTILWTRSVDEPSGLPLRELVLNISEGCNLTCSYCFAAQGTYGKGAQQWMSGETLKEALTDALYRFPSLDRIKLFGGEPLMNRKAITACCEVLHEMQRGDPGRHISIGCVTNGTLYCDTLVQLVRDLNLELTISVDGPPAIHDKTRRDRVGRGTFGKIVRNVGRFREAGLHVSAIESVFTPEHIAQGFSMLGLARYLVETFEVDNVIIRPVATGDGDDLLKLREFAASVRCSARELLEAAVEERKAENSPLSNALLDFTALLMKGERAIGWCGLGIDTITVSASGEIFPCYTLLEDRDKWKLAEKLPDWAPGALEKSRVESALLAANPRTIATCRDCCIRAICAGSPGSSVAFGGELTAVDAVGCSYRVGAVEGVLQGWLKSVDASRTP